jgi:tRNA uridine 5-carbamoylmethylation protein Kti12
MLTVVTGPPCSGKSTLARQRAKPGHILVGA